MGANTAALEKTGDADGLVIPGTVAVEEEFTIELFAHIDDFSTSDTTVVLAAQVSEITEAGTSWAFQIRMNGFGGSQPGELMFVVSDGTTWHPVRSGVVLHESTDYYLAGSFDLTDQSAIFHIDDLTDDQPLQTVTTTHALANLNPDSTFVIGARQGFSVDGILDEVRFSNHVLSEGEFADQQHTGTNIVVDTDYCRSRDLPTSSDGTQIAAKEEEWDRIYTMNRMEIRSCKSCSSCRNAWCTRAKTRRDKKNSSTCEN